MFGTLRTHFPFPRSNGEHDGRGFVEGLVLLSICSQVHARTLRTLWTPPHTPIKFGEAEVKVVQVNTLWVSNVYRFLLKTNTPL